MKTAKVSETQILACFTKTCTRQNYQPYSSWKVDSPRLLKGAAGGTKLLTGVSREITLLIGMYGEMLKDAVADVVLLWSVVGTDVCPVWVFREAMGC